MNVEKTTLHKFFDGVKIFTIPVYQRKYDWDLENCRQLFADIEKIISTKKSHFLGTFVYQQRTANDGLNEFIIIDGQQRITSIVLLAKALYESFQENSKKEDICGRYIKIPYGEHKDETKLNPTEYDKNIFEKILNDSADISFDRLEKSFSAYKNYLFFKEKIFESNYSANDLYSAIKNLNIIGICLDEENPQEIFESLNSTGRALTESDLIRNYLLMPLNYDKQEDFYKRYWLEVERLLNSSDRVENFMIQYLIVKRKSDSITKNNKRTKLSNKNLYENFKLYFDNNNLEVENCLADIYRYAKFYRKVIFSNNDIFDKLSALEKKFYELTFLLEANNAPIILMYLYDKFNKKIIDEKFFVAMLDALISYTFRAKVCSLIGITSQFAANLILRLDKKISFDMETFWEEITAGQGKSIFPNDKKFHDDLVDSQLFSTIKSEGCKYLLYKLELKHEKDLPSYNKIEIEQIMPRRLNEAWKKYLASKKDLSAHEIWRDTLGNLALIKQNEKNLRADFKTKKKFYSSSKFSYTRDLRICFDWTSKQIQLRAQKLANEAVKIWTLPEKYNVRVVNADKVFDLDEDFARFKGTKPAILSISNNEKNVQHWKDLMAEIVKTFYALDKDAFKQAATQDNIWRNFFNEESAGNYLKIEDDCYINTTFDTNTMLKIIKTLVENFDSICDTNFKEEIWFTLKK